MSLSRILNNDPEPILTSSSLSAHGLNSHPSSHSRTHDPPTPSTSDGYREPHPSGQHGQPHHNGSYHASAGWDRYPPSAYPQADNYPQPRNANGNVASQAQHYPDMDQHRPTSPDENSQEDMPTRKSAAAAVVAEATSGRKKRRTYNDDADYQPAQRRSSRRQSSRVKQARPPSPPPDVPEQEPQTPQMTEEERRLASSDLDDCEEVWLAELADYVVETRKRHKEVERWFELSCMERNSEVARDVAQRYESRLASIPPPPPPMPLHPIQPPDDERAGAFRDSASSVVSVEDYDSRVDPDDEWDESSRFNGNEDAARALEDFALGRSHSGNGHRGSKRTAAGAVSDSGSDFDVVIRDRNVHKKRRLEGNGNGSVAAADELERSLSGQGHSSGLIGISGKGKGRHKHLPVDQQSMDSAPSTPSGRRKGGKRGDGLDGHNASGSRDGTPTGSGRASPAPGATLFELDESIPPLRKAKKMDQAAMMKRVRALEEAQRKVWLNIARKDVAKVYKYHASGYQARQAQSKRVAHLASMQARRPFTKTPKSQKEIATRGKRLMREMLVSWKKNEKEEKDWRRRQRKEDMDRQRMEEEKREATRQARKLEFLISQTELYSHFVGSKLKTAEIEGGEGTKLPDAPAGAEFGEVDPTSLQDIDFDDDDETNLYKHASKNAQDALAMAKAKAQQFDSQAALDRTTSQALKLAKAQAHIRDDSEAPSAEQSASQTPLVDLDSDELNFQNPTSMGELTVQQPKMLMAQLKEYQLKGLNWLATLYEQGINGILADEMGLGKTVQSISLLAYLAEKHDIWGPFLVVSPASTLHNWQQEITRFAPHLKALPYWGNVKDRATLRKVWGKKDISYDRDAPFHVLITSYQLVTQDQQYFQRVKWQYMILDEAQNIKNSSSVRWKTLLGFNCRNRLLLTGTPIQNSMQELWALLHFIMPSLFDSHDEFNEWFSKDIEGAAEGKGNRFSEYQLRRLHMILKPFMLRRVKRHVQNELSEKIEKDIYVDLSARQRALYRALLTNVSITELLEKAANIGDAESARSLMNLVMQFRKVCNHPELFERADVIAPFSFTRPTQPTPMSRDTDFVNLPYSTSNPIEYTIPDLFYRDGGLLNLPHESSSLRSGIGSIRKMDIWDTDRIHRSMLHGHSAFSFLRLLRMSPADIHAVRKAPLIQRELLALQEEAQRAEEDPTFLEPTFAPRAITQMLRKPPCQDDGTDSFQCPSQISLAAWHRSPLSRPTVRLYVPPVVAPPIALYCTDRSFLEHRSLVLDAPLESLALYGIPRHLWDFQPALDSYRERAPCLPPSGLIGTSSSDQLPPSTMQVPEAKRLVYDSAKLAALDVLLQELKAGDHRVLIYSQMTRMLDLMEEYLVFRQYRYLRLDGSSKLEDRRDMVIEWQTRPDIFVFLLSTRAGGLGINLTAADTVVFYDHDWNPSNDSQAMDRAHRLGQTRQVTVYRLITKGTIDERIIQLARVKKDVQDIVVGNKGLNEVAKPSDIVSLLLNDDQLANLDPSASQSTKGLDKQPMRSVTNTGGDIWNEEGDEFFVQKNAGDSTAAVQESTVEDTTAVSGSARKGRRRDPNAPRRKPGPKPGTKRKKAAVAD